MHTYLEQQDTPPTSTRWPSIWSLRELEEEEMVTSLSGTEMDPKDKRWNNEELLLELLSLQ